MRGGGQPRKVRGGHVNRRADEQTERPHRGLAGDRRRDVRVRVVRGIVYGRRGGDHKRNTGEGSGGGDGVQRDGTAGGSELRGRGATGRRQGRAHRSFIQWGSGLWIQHHRNVQRMRDGGWLYGGWNLVIDS